MHSFHAASFSEVPEEHKSPHSAWETPDPGFWTRKGFAVLRADEVGLGQSPGFMDTMSSSTSACFADVIEWAAERLWSTGRIGLLGISYYAGSQWRVAARQPKGLCCMIPWEGMSDYYRDRCRHGGILSNTFINFWWNRQVGPNQYGLAGRAARKWGPDTIEGDMAAEELELLRNDQRVDNEQNRFCNDEYYASRNYDMQDIRVPLLSVANWGGILLHLRGNVHGFMNAGSELKYLRFVVGRHDLPFYSENSARMQLSFLNAFLKDHDNEGWSTGRVPKVDLVLRQGDVGCNDPVAEQRFLTRVEHEWPIARTKYTRYYLTSSGQLVDDSSSEPHPSITVSYDALGSLQGPQAVTFTTPPFTKQTEITGHLVAHLNVSAMRYPDDRLTEPMDIDLFLTLRHISPQGTEVFYTGTVGDPVPVTKGWLRCSLRKTNTNNPRHRPWLPYRDYRSHDVALLAPGEMCTVDVEIWPTNVVVEKGGVLVLELSSGDTQGAGIFEHNSSVDRPPERFRGMNHIHFGQGLENWLLLPVIPAVDNSVG